LGLKGGKVALTVTVANDAFPDDTKFEVVGLGEFTNGEAREVTEEQEKVFVSMYQMPVEEKVGESGNVDISGTTSIENMDEVLGVDISDTMPVDVGTGTEAPEEPTTEEPPPDPGAGETEIINPPEGGGN
jgi:hypothetical protein